MPADSGRKYAGAGAAGRHAEGAFLGGIGGRKIVGVVILGGIGVSPV